MYAQWRNIRNLGKKTNRHPRLATCALFVFACIIDEDKGTLMQVGWPSSFYRVSCKWSRVVQEVRFKVHDPKAHSKGGTLENTINGRADEEAPPPPQHLIHPGKDISKLYGE